MSIKTSYAYPSDVRNAYLRLIVKILTEKYHVFMTAMSDELNWSRSTLSMFAHNNRNLSEDRLNYLEDYLTDLYGATIKDEVPQAAREFDRFMKQNIATLI